MEKIYIFSYSGALVLFILAGLGIGNTSAEWIVGVVLILVVPHLYEFILSSLIRAKIRSQPFASHAQDAESFRGRLPIVYSDHYNIHACGIEKMHPFDSQKYRRVMSRLLESGLLRADEVIEPQQATREQLMLVHTPCYLASLHSTTCLTSIVEVPICCLPSFFTRDRVIEPFLYATAGSIMGARLALTHGWAINLGGGFHHASSDRGSGFCAFADITLAIKYLRKDYPDRVKNVMIIDLDAHQGNGHERDFLNDQRTFILDVFNPHIFPGDEVAKRAIARAVHVTSRDDDERYLTKLRDNLESSFQAFKPDFIVYNAGTDCMENDPLGCLSLTPDGIIRRDETVFAAALSRRIPLLMVLSGGYQMTNAPCIANSILNLERKLQIVSKARSGLAAREEVAVDLSLSAHSHAPLSSATVSGTGSRDRSASSSEGSSGSGGS